MHKAIEKGTISSSLFIIPLLLLLLFSIAAATAVAAGRGSNLTRILAHAGFTAVGVGEVTAVAVWALQTSANWKRKKGGKL